MCFNFTLSYMTCPQIEKLWACWHRTIKTPFNLPFGTHRYLLHDLVPYGHIQTMIIKWFLKFDQKIYMSTNPFVILLRNKQANDWRSTFVKNSSHLAQLARVENFCDANLDSFTVHPVPVDQKWRVNLLRDLLDEQYNPISNLTREEIQMIMSYVCCT